MEQTLSPSNRVNYFTAKTVVESVYMILEGPHSFNLGSSLSEKYYHISSGCKKMVKPCWKPFVEGDGSRGGDPNGRVDGLWWYKNLGHHIHGEYSMAVIQANSLLEDQS